MNLRNVPSRGRFRHLTLILGTVATTVVLWFATTHGSAQSGSGQLDEHGATPVLEQQKSLDKLFPSRDWTRPPQGVDALIWATFFENADEAMTTDRVALGRRLYFDKTLSGDGTVACSTCHDVKRGFTDQRPVSEGIDGKLGRRNAPTVLNAALIEPQFLDGRSRTLVAQAVQPILNPIEMGNASAEQVVARLKKDPSYLAEFKRAYGRDLNYDDLGRAIGAFERTLIALDAPFDDFVGGKKSAVSDDVKKGWVLFNGKARCVTCHAINGSNPLGSDFKFHNIGVSALTQDFEGLASKALVALKANSSEQELDRLALATDFSELGRFMVTKNYADIGGFRSSQLRNVGITGPYMHDGSMQTLWDVVDHYNRGGEANTFLDGGIEPLALSEEEVDQVVAFLFSLTDKRFDSENSAAMKTQQKRAKTTRPFRDNDLAHRKKFGFGILDKK